MRAGGEVVGAHLQRHMINSLVKDVSEDGAKLHSALCVPCVCVDAGHERLCGRGARAR